MTLWLAETGGKDGPGFRQLACRPPRAVFVRNPRAALTSHPLLFRFEGHGDLTAELHPEPGASPGIPVLASVTLATGRKIRVPLDWCADATNVAARRILPAARDPRLPAQQGQEAG
jgi:hypothetical protein